MIPRLGGSRGYCSTLLRSNSRQLPTESILFVQKLFPPLLGCCDPLVLSGKCPTRPSGSDPSDLVRVRFPYTSDFDGYMSVTFGRNRQTRTSTEIALGRGRTGRIHSDGSDTSRTKLKGRNIPIRVGIAPVQTVQVWRKNRCFT